MATHGESASRAKSGDDLQGSPCARSDGESQAGATHGQGQPLSPQHAHWDIPCASGRLQCLDGRASGGRHDSAYGHPTVLQPAHANLETPLIVYLYHGDEAG
jgi:hypothetical protein